MTPNKYVDFVSDKDFLECVRWVCDSYPKKSSKIDMESLQRNVIDSFKMVFDVFGGEINVDDWLQNEMIRQNDKTINNKIGEFHQKLLGKVNGWKNLGTGDESKVDLMKNDKTIFVELKNKYNTMNSDATDKCRDKLEKAIKDNPKSTAYWAFIVSKDGDSGEETWVYGGRREPRIKKIWGKKVYELVTGDPGSLEKTWKALPQAIKDLTRSTFSISRDEQKKLEEFFRIAFRS